jgi:hypothetical protein
MTGSETMRSHSKDDFPQMTPIYGQYTQIIQTASVAKFCTTNQHRSFVLPSHTFYRAGYSDWQRAGRPRDRSSSPGRVKKFQFSISSKLTLGPTQPLIQFVRRALSPGTKRLGREADHSPPTSAGGQENVHLYIQSPIHLQGVMLN